VVAVRVPRRIQKIGESYPLSAPEALAVVATVEYEVVLASAVRAARSCGTPDATDVVDARPHFESTRAEGGQCTKLRQPKRLVGE
jgi:hypothetical protein